MKLTKYPALLILLALGCTSTPPPQEAPPSDRPNVILVITDDQGFGDIGFHGNRLIKTPVLDAFAEQSVRFSNFYVSPVCAPTRSSLMTGRYSLRTGVRDTYNGGAIMASSEVTIAEVGGPIDTAVVAAIPRLQDVDGGQMAPGIPGKRLRKSVARRSHRSGF